MRTILRTLVSKCHHSIFFLFPRLISFFISMARTFISFQDKINLSHSWFLLLPTSKPCDFFVFHIILSSSYIGSPTSEERSFQPVLLPNAFLSQAVCIWYHLNSKLWKLVAILTNAHFKSFPPKSRKLKKDLPLTNF